MIFYNDVVYAAFRRGFNNESITEFAQYQYLLKEENKTRRKLEALKKKVNFLAHLNNNSLKGIFWRLIPNENFL